MTSELAAALASAASSGALVGLVAWQRERWRTRQPAAVESANLSAVARARDELEADNTRLRDELTEVRTQYAEDRRRWWAERQQLIDEIDQLEIRVRTLLDEIAQLRSRHGLPGRARPAEAAD